MDPLPGLSIDEMWARSPEAMVAWDQGPAHEGWEPWFRPSAIGVWADCRCWNSHACQRCRVWLDGQWLRREQTTFGWWDQIRPYDNRLNTGWPLFLASPERMLWSMREYLGLRSPAQHRAFVTREFLRSPWYDTYDHGWSCDRRIGRTTDGILNRLAYCVMSHRRELIIIGDRRDDACVHAWSLAEDLRNRLKIAVRIEIDRMPRSPGAYYIDHVSPWQQGIRLHESP